MIRFRRWAHAARKASKDKKKRLCGLKQKILQKEREFAFQPQSTLLGRINTGRSGARVMREITP